MMDLVKNKAEEAIDVIMKGTFNAQSAQTLYYLVKIVKDASEVQRMQKMGRFFGSGRIGETFDRIAECWTDYTESKRRYRDSLSDTDRRKMVNSLRVMFGKLGEMVDDLVSSTDCQDEREIIESYRRGIL